MDAEQRRRAERERQLTATMMCTLGVFLVLLVLPRLIYFIVAQFVNDKRSLAAVKALVPFGKFQSFHVYRVFVPKVFSF